jgi:hypothetical protein
MAFIFTPLLILQQSVTALEVLADSSGQYIEMISKVQQYIYSRSASHLQSHFYERVFISNSSISKQTFVNISIRYSECDKVF